MPVTPVLSKKDHLWKLDALRHLLSAQTCVQYPPASARHCHKSAFLQVFALWERTLYNKRTRYDEDVSCLQAQAGHATVEADVSLRELRPGDGP